ncbi:MAG: hypothetical protein M3R70_07540 [Actinomycetota bacterium]|nr:hypothetical protein [Actinomycetota bacterium]
MKRAVTTAMVLLVTLVLAAPAGATTPTERKLAKQIKVLQKQVKTLKKDVLLAHDLGLIGIWMAGCTAAAAADAFQGTWKTIDPSGVKFGAQQPVNDYVACQALRESQITAVTRSPNVATVSVFQTILNAFKPPSSARSLNAFWP